jgi:predicted transcriptional regulator with HTH domain
MFVYFCETYYIMKLAPSPTNFQQIMLAVKNMTNNCSWCLNDLALRYNLMLLCRFLP